MKVGDYVRNKYGIAKVVDIKKRKDILNGIYFDVLVFDNNICFLANKETGERKEDTPLFNKLPITKDIDLNKVRSSSDITDLVEDGDIISYKDGSICRIFKVEGNYFLLKDRGLEQYYENKEWFTDDIEFIVTKEQFSSMGYKVGE